MCIPPDSGHTQGVRMVNETVVSFIPVAVDTSGHIYDDFSRLLFLHPHRETSSLDSDIPEESGQFRFLRTS